MRPKIGISCDLEKRVVRGYELFFPLLGGWYHEAVVKAGGLPLLLPPTQPALAQDYINGIDALVLSGGDFDIDPIHYGRPRHEKLGELSPERTDFEWALLAAAEARDLPVLGICGGMQLLNVYRGGTLFQDLDTERPGETAHRQVGDKREPSHQVTIVPASHLAKLIGSEPLPVNSTHHQAVSEVGRGLVCDATAEDGLCEAISDPSRSFVVGVQWHPEAMVHAPRHLGLYQALVAAAQSTATSHR